MSGTHFDADWTANVVVPVKRVGDRWEFFYGGDVPVRDGALGELRLCADLITDERFLKRVTQELTVRILEEGAGLLVALSDRETSGGRAGDWPEPHPLGVPLGTTRFERIRLGPLRKKVEEPSPHVALEPGGLWLKLKGLERCELHASSVQMPPGFEPASASSLNHAFTMLSQAYEKHRISNTGNVYTRVFYQDHDKRWYPLDDLRRGVQNEGERRLLAGLWEQVEQALGWRPTPPAPDRKRKKR